MKSPIPDEQLEHWLTEAAETSMPTLPASDVLAKQLQKKFRRRKAVRRLVGTGMAGTTVAVIAAAAIFYGGGSSQRPTEPIVATVPDIELQRLQQRIVALEQELEAQKARLELLAAGQNPRDPSVISAEALLPPEALAQIQWEKTAVMILNRAEHLAAFNRNQEAAVEYRRIVEDFPSTSLVETAKKQIRQLNSNL